MIAKWIPNIKPNGALKCRDFRDYGPAFYNLGYIDADFKKCTIGKRESTRLEYLVIA